MWKCPNTFEGNCSWEDLLEQEGEFIFLNDAALPSSLLKIVNVSVKANRAAFALTGKHFSSFGCVFY